MGAPALRDEPAGDLVAAAWECRVIRDALPLEAPALADAIPNLALRAVCGLLLDCFRLLGGVEPQVVAVSSDSDAMGGLEGRLELGSGAASLHFAYEQSIRDSWSSLEVVAHQASYSGVGGFSWDCRLIGTGYLKLSFWQVPRETVAAILDAAGKRFVEVTPDGERYRRSLSSTTSAPHGQQRSD